jgi:hypothetical protein
MLKEVLHACMHVHIITVPFYLRGERQKNFFRIGKMLAVKDSFELIALFSINQVSSDFLL